MKTTNEIPKEFEYLAAISSRYMNSTKIEEHNSAQSIQGILARERRLMDMIQNNLQLSSRLDIPLDDADTYGLLSAGKTDNVWGLNSHGMQKLLQKLKPENFEQLKAAITLYRPETLQNGLTEIYVRHRHGYQKYDFLPPVVEETFQKTLGVFLYQEQIDEFLKSFCNMTYEDAQVARMLIQQGEESDEALRSVREKLRLALENQGWETRIRNRCVYALFTHGKAAMSERHATSFARMSYQMAWVKVHFPVLFYGLRR